MRNTGLEEAQAGIKIARGNISNPRYADDTTLMAESRGTKELFNIGESSVQFSRSVVSDSLRPHELQHTRLPCPSPTPGVHSDSRPSSLERGDWKSWPKTQHSKNKDHGIRSHHFMANRWGNNGNSDRFYFLGLHKVTVDGDCSCEIKWCLLLRRYDQPRQHIKKQRHYFAKKGPSSQSNGFSSSHVWMWELEYKESLVPKNGCFWTVVLEKTLESPLDGRDPTSPPKRKSVLNIHWKDWCWSWNSNSLATWYRKLTH